MAKATTSKIMGTITLGHTALVPLEVAHQIQALLAEHAVSYATMYRSNAPNVPYMTDYEMPKVEVVRTSAVIHDAIGLTWRQIETWGASIRDGDNAAILSPKEFTAIAGE